MGRLEKVWDYHTGAVSDGKGDLPATVWSATPVIASDTMYIGTPFYRIIVLDPSTGVEKWAFDKQSELAALTQPTLKNRGVAYWHDAAATGQACDKTVYIGTMDARLFEVAADSGAPCTRFADNGVLDVNQWNTTNDRWPLSLLQPPTVVGNLLILGWAGQNWEFQQAPPGLVFAIDARTGELVLDFQTLPESLRATSGTANIWTAICADVDRGLVYLPVSSPSPNDWGGNRAEDAPYATSTTALDIKTGEVVWSRQWVHHVIWDYDINAAPTRMDITVDGLRTRITDRRREHVAPRAIRQALRPCSL